MADYTDSRPQLGAMYPAGAVESPWSRLEPLMTPEQLVQRQLFGIPLMSQWRVAGEANQRITPDMLKDTIRRSVSILEHESKLLIMPVQLKSRQPFDRQEFDNFGYLQMPHRPVASVESVSIQDPQGTNIFTVPIEWIEGGYLWRGRLYLIPLSPAQTGATFTALTGGNPFGYTIMSMMAMNGVPAYWTIQYTAGFPDGMVPVVVNELTGIIAAQEVLGLLAPTFARAGSHSLSIDALSQSVSTPGAELFQIRMKELEDKKQLWLKRLKAMYGRNIVMSSI